MSLFPAYSGETEPPNKPATSVNPPEKWLENESFLKIPPIDFEILSSESGEALSSISDLEPLPKKRKKKKKDKLLAIAPEIKLDFDGSEEFYVDKKAERGNLKINTLHRPACPKYRTWKYLGRVRTTDIPSFKRYFSKKNTSKLSDSGRVIGSRNVYLVTEEEFLDRNKEFNQLLNVKPNEVENWIEFVDFQDNSPLRSITNTQLAERKMDILDKAIVYNPNDDRLYSQYVDVLTIAFPSFEVSKIIEKLIEKEPTNFVLWRGLIMAMQRSMARCLVPDVLKLYERAMQNMYKKKRSDETMLSLFQSCAFFLRQSGLYEQFFALIKLALELNVSPDRFNSIQPIESEQEILVDYEEVVLSSGLPMNEIWLRIEKLRTNFYYLPCPPGFTCSDPQRMVFNEDVCFFIFPLTQKENSLKLAFIILRLLKIPLPVVHDLIETSRDESEFDAVEELLSVFLCPSFSNDHEFDTVFLELVKELGTGPSYFSHSIGHGIYMKTVLDMLTLLASSFEGLERMVINLIWLRFERILVILNRMTNKLSDASKKEIKGRMKKFLKSEENRNQINYFVEYALIEAEMGNIDLAISILESSLSQDFEKLSNKDKYHISNTLVELLIKHKKLEEATLALASIALNIPYSTLKEEEKMTESRKLVTVSYLQKNLDNLIAIEKNVDSLEEEQLILPDFLINSIKCTVFAQLLIKSKSEAVKSIRTYLKTFKTKSNKRHTFVREKLNEILINTLTLKTKTNSDTLTWTDLSQSLSEFPNNVFLNKRMATFRGQMWHKVKSTVLNCKSSMSVLFLIASIRHRCLEEVQQLENVPSISHKFRVKHLLKTVVSDNSELRKNPLMWRLYLRILFEMEKSLDQCKNALFSALDECPWNKSIYMDGAVFVPGELTQIQDLIIEKQLRIYALPEELEILRCDTV